MSNPIRMQHLLILGLAAAAAATGCVKDSTTATSPTNGDTTATASFIGYSNAKTKQTTCGNCHVLKQESWVQTGHAKAWTDLQSSGHVTPACEQCHTVNGFSNVGPDSGGFFSVKTVLQESTFVDVQCEACHGPGAAHVMVPDETQPIAYFTSRDSVLGVGCGQCHSGAPHNPFYEDWSRGAHGILEAPAISNGGTCLQCHEGKTVEQRFGGSNVFVEASSTTAMPIGCATCHDPHGSSNTHELRESITVRDTTNLCIRCHERNAVPDTSNTRGPHSPQGPTFLGTSGWRPAGFTWDSTNVPTHSNPSANPLLCATCHLDTLDVTNGAGQLAWHYTGHSFYAIPCVDTAGIDSTNSCDVSQRSFAACTTSGCHASQDAARALYESLTSELQYFASVLWDDVNGDGKIDAGDTGLLTEVPSTEFKRDSIITVAEGALFNVQLISVDASHGVHNPPYLRALLIATIEAVQNKYGLSAPAAAQARMAEVARTLGVRVATR